MLLPIQLSPASPEPMYHQIEVQLRGLILGGKLTEGTPLPSIRELALDLSCSVITIRRVYQDLENEGLIRTRQGTGTFVARVETEDRERNRLETVSRAFREAVSTASRYDCSPEEMRRLLEQAIAERKLESRQDGKGEHAHE
ncbi:GntR family transcriptional regulator [Paenibacillus mesotrionivorans]|uniref:GntR family transcriptional regulator n=1 Tax=Paenibacillus mesotrionivorans TaxID=3160968 RepID=A0ACC7NUU0_9BACL